MNDVILFAALGLGSGALTAALGLGIVLTWRGSGVVNLAAGAMAMFIAYEYRSLRTAGTLFLPPINVELKSGGIGTWQAFAISMLVAAGLGLVLYSLVFRPLREASALAKMVASSGVLLTLQAIVILKFGTGALSVPDILPNGPQDVVHLGDASIPVNRFLLAAVAVILAAGLWALFKYTRYGLETRAAAENEKAAVLAGLSPNMLGYLNWMLGSVIAGAVGVLAAPITQLDPIALAMAVIPALGAALVGKFESFGVTAAAGILIGIAQSEVIYVQTMDWFPLSNGLPIPGLAAGLPFVVIAAAMFARGRSLPTRGTIETPKFPAAPRPDHLWMRVPPPVLVTAVMLISLNPAWRQATINSLIGVVVCMSLVVITGYLGQTSLLHMALAGTAGFVLSNLATGAGLPLPVAVLLAVAASCLLGLITALPVLRVRGVNLAIISLAAAVAVQEIYFKNPSWAGGQAGAEVPSPALGTLRFGPADDFLGSDGSLPNSGFGLFCLLVVVCVGLAVVQLRRSTLGQQMLAVRANERAGASVGINVPVTKMIGFGISSAIAGMAGVLYAFNFGSVTYTRFDAITAVAFLAFAYLGGISTVSGAVIGGMLATQGVVFLAMQSWFGLSDRYTLLVAGLAVIVTVVTSPNGIAGAARDVLAWRPSAPQQESDSEPARQIARARA